MTQIPLPAEALAQLSAVIDGVIRVGPVAAIPRVLSELGQDPAALMGELGLASNLFEHQENTIAFVDVGRLFSLAVRRTGCPHFGLLVGQRAGVESLGVVGMLGRHSPTLATGLRNIILHLHLHDRGAVPSLSVSGDKAILAYTIHLPDLEATAQMYDTAMGVACNVLHRLAGPDWRPLEVLLSRSRPKDPEPYRQHFRVPVRFDAEVSGIVFAASCLERPIPGRDPALYLGLQARIAALHAECEADIVAQVRRVACNLLLGGGGTLESVAEVFTMHPRTLNRRLKERGTSFRAIRNTLRLGLACHLLSATQMPLPSIAELLGYGDTSAFNRAFRRWTGIPPGGWRTRGWRGCAEIPPADQGLDL
ncbi:Helix-turn-helix-domain containing protein AraC type [Thiocapsa sp. KS1]|nr:AraC family transcriptional regulator [Thiocapsa sp. KS1]CRI63651.1 Helix-turn-helix-domain containing protein AraC type [Thiocapsa sp. KS1]